MSAEIISIETSKELARLRKENKKLEEIVIMYDKKINSLTDCFKQLTDLVQNFKSGKTTHILFSELSEIIEKEKI